MTKVSEWFKNQQQKFNEGLQKRGPSMLQNIWNDWTGITNVNKSLEAQAIENEKTREYNLQLARENNIMNIAQWNRQNEYNSPAAQKGRLEAAGLNADLMYGDGGISNVSASSPAMTSGAPASPMDWSSLANKVSPMEAVSSMLGNKLVQAQIDNINADTQKKGAETSILSDDATFRKAYNQGQLDTMYSQIKLQGSQVDLNDMQITKMQHEIQQIDSLTEQLQAGIDKIRNDIKNDNSRLDIEKLMSSAQIKQAYESANLTRKQAERLVNEWDYMVTNYNDMHAINVAHGAKLRQEGANLKFHADMTYGDRDRDASLYLQSMKFLNQLTTFALPFFKK